MIRLVAIFIFVVISLEGNAQKSSVKASVLFFPLPTIYNVSTGVEYVFKNKFAAQLSFTIYGYDFENSHGEDICFNSLIPEFRYYFGPQESFRSQFFTALFVEVGKLYEFSNADNGMNESYFDSAKGTMVNPGILLGKNIPLGNRFYLEIFIAWNYKFISKMSKYYENGIADYRQVYEEDPDFRMRLNLAYSF
jgi:hypothetical protein